MVKTSYFDRDGMKKGAWSEDEDSKLKGCIERLGGCVSNWRLLPVAAGKTSFSGQAAFGLKRCGKSCRLRWMNYLKPGLNRGKITKLEEDLIIELHNELGNKWSAIAANFPGRTDNDIKNYWHAHIQKRNGGAARAATIVPNQDEVVSEQGLSEESMEWKADADYKAAERVWYINLPPLFEEEELYGFGLWQNDIISDSSDAARFLQEDFVIDPVGEESFSMRLW